MLTALTFLLDESGSMGEPIYEKVDGRHVVKKKADGTSLTKRDTTIEAFNAYLDELRTAPDILVSLVQFNTEGLVKTCVRTPIKETPKLSYDNFDPIGGTPLIQAATTVVKAAKAAAKDPEKWAEEKLPEKHIFVIQTDGEENASHPEFTNEALKALIDELQAEGWGFVFLGAGFDAYSSARKMGFERGSTMSYTASDVKMSASGYRAMASNTRSFSEGAVASMDFSDDQKAAAGDTWKDNALGPDVQPLAPPPPPVAQSRRPVEKFEL